MKADRTNTSSAASRLNPAPKQNENGGQLMERSTEGITEEELMEGKAWSEYVTPWSATRAGDDE